MGCMQSRPEENANTDGISERQPLLNENEYRVVTAPLNNAPNNELNNANGGQPPVLVGSTHFQDSTRGFHHSENYTQGFNNSTQPSNGYGVSRPYSLGQPGSFTELHSVASDGPHVSYGENSMGNVPNGEVTPQKEGVSLSDIQTKKGKEVLVSLKKAYSWKDRFNQPCQDFLALMDRLYMECQLHLTALSSRGDVDSRREADAIVNEMIVLRNHWGSKLLPNSICNAFVRERIPQTLGMEQRQFRIDCAQFFEPVAFYGNQQGNPGELMKLFRFSVYDVTKNEVVLRYYLERSNVTQLYHVLCFTCENYRGQVQPYGSEVPSYWEIRQHMMEDVYSRLLSALSDGTHPAPQTHAATIFPATRGTGPIIIQVPTPVYKGQN